MAIYQASRLFPANTAIDGNLSNLFEFICNGSTIDKYNAKVFRQSDNVQVYTTGDVPLSPVRYNGDKVTFTVPDATFVNGVDYKWQVTTYQGASSATSTQVVFKANNTPSVSSSTPATINSQSYNFQFTYTQAQNVPVVYWYMEFKDSTNTIIETTDRFYTGNISYTYSGFVSGQSYSVRAYTVNASGITTASPIYNFTVSYQTPNITVIPTIIQNCINSIINIVWGAAIQVTGMVVGTFSYLTDFGLIGNYALKLNNGSYYSADVDIPEDQTTIVPIVVDGFTTGVLTQLNGVLGSYDFGYDGTRFYFNNKEIYGYSQPLPLPTNEFIVFMRPTDCWVKIDNAIYQLKTE